LLVEQVVVVGLGVEVEQVVTEIHILQKHLEVVVPPKL
jgi:hypothetical protein